MTTNNDRSFLSIFGYLLIFIIWIAIALFNREVAGKPFPYPWEAIASLFRPGAEQLSLFAHAGVSLLRWGFGFIIASFTGILTGLLMALLPSANSLLSPFMNMLQLIPGLAWVPIVMILFGLGNFSTVFMIAVTAFVPVVINTRAGINQIDKILFKAAEMMELSSREMFFRITLPGASPSIISGLRVGAANGFRVLISAEMIVGSGIGLGFSIFRARWNLDYDAAFGALILIILSGLLFDRLLFLPVEAVINRKRGLG